MALLPAAFTCSSCHAEYDFPPVKQVCLDCGEYLQTPDGDYLDPAPEPELDELTAPGEAGTPIADAAYALGPDDSHRDSYQDVEPFAVTFLPIGGLIDVSGLNHDGIASFGDASLRLSADSSGHPVALDARERVLSQWIAEQTSGGMFEVLGACLTDVGLERGCVATGALANYLLLTDFYLRGAVPGSRSAKVRTNTGVFQVSPGFVFLFAIPLVDIELIDGNKRDIAVAAGNEGLVARWLHACGVGWEKVASGPWHRDNTLFAQAVLEATIVAKARCSDERVRSSAMRAAKVDTSTAYATGRRTTVTFAAPRS